MIPPPHSHTSPPLPLPNRQQTWWKATSVSSTPGPAHTVTETTPAAGVVAAAAGVVAGETITGVAATAAPAAVAAVGAETGEGDEDTPGQGRRLTTGTRVEGAAVEVMEGAGRVTTSVRGAIWVSARGANFEWLCWRRLLGRGGGMERGRGGGARAGG